MYISDLRLLENPFRALVEIYNSPSQQLLRCRLPNQNVLIVCRTSRCFRNTTVNSSSFLFLLLEKLIRIKFECYKTHPNINWVKNNVFNKLLYASDFVK